MGEKRRIVRKRRPVNLNEANVNTENNQEQLTEEVLSVDSMELNSSYMENESFGLYEEIEQNADKTTYNSIQNNVNNNFSNNMMQANELMIQKSKPSWKKIIIYVLTVIIIVAGSFIGAIKYAQYLAKNNGQLINNNNNFTQDTTTNNEQQNIQQNIQQNTQQNNNINQNILTYTEQANPLQPIQIIWPKGFKPGSYDIKLIDNTDKPTFFLSGYKDGLGNVILQYDDKGQLKRFYVIVNTNTPQQPMQNNKQNTKQNASQTKEDK